MELTKYWIGQKVCLGFSIISYRKTQVKFLANPTNIFQINICPRTLRSKQSCLFSRLLLSIICTFPRARLISPLWAFWLECNNISLPHLPVEWVRINNRFINIQTWKSQTILWINWNFLEQFSSLEVCLYITNKNGKYALNGTLYHTWPSERKLNWVQSGIISV